MIVYIWTVFSLTQFLLSQRFLLVISLISFQEKKRHSSLSFFCFKEGLCLFRFVFMCVQVWQTWKGRRGHENPWAEVTGSHAPPKMEEQAALLTAEPSLQPQLILLFKDTQKLNCNIVSYAPGCFSHATVHCFLGQHTEIWQVLFYNAPSIMSYNSIPGLGCHLVDRVLASCSWALGSIPSTK